MLAVDLQLGKTPARKTLLSAQALHPRLVPDRLCRLIDAAVGAEDQEPVEAAREPPVVSDGEHRPFERIESLFQCLGRFQVEIVGRLVKQQQRRAAQLEQQDL